jgi:RNase P/RNase MRP subunit p29
MVELVEIGLKVVADLRELERTGVELTLEAMLVTKKELVGMLVVVLEAGTELVSAGVGIAGIVVVVTSRLVVTERGAGEDGTVEGTETTGAEVRTGF